MEDCEDIKDKEIQVTIGVFEALLATYLGGLGENAQQNANMDGFSSQLFCFQIFFTVKSVLNQRNILSE